VPTIAYVLIAVAIVVALLFFVLRRKPALPQVADEQPEKRPAPLKKKPRKERPEPKAEAKAPADEAPDKEEPDEAPAREEPPPESAVPVSIEQEEPPLPPPTRRKKDVKGLRKGLGKVRGATGLFGRLKELFSGKKEIDPDIVEEIEEILLTSDVGVKTTESLLADIREGLEKNELKDTDKVWEALRARASDLLDLKGGGAIRLRNGPTVVLMVGVNGTGKTTTIGKLATKYLEQDKKVLLVAGDTFRAAAVAQLRAWAKRVGCDLFAGKDGADPASVVFDAVSQGAETGADVILVDTAGRLHTKSNLMDELEKVFRTTGKALDGAPHETLLVLDGTTGQNAIQQAQEFAQSLPLTGIVLTKLDGTAKGGVVLAIASEHELPVRYIGVGERPQDLRDFDAEEFVEAMLGQADDSAAAA